MASELELERIFSDLQAFLLFARGAENSPTEPIIEEILLKLESYGHILLVMLDVIELEEGQSFGLVGLLELHTVTPQPKALIVSHHKSLDHVGG